MSKLKIPKLPDIDPMAKVKIKRALPGTIITSIILLVVVLTLFHSTDGFTTMIDTEPAVIVTERDYMSFTSYTLRDEKVLYSEFSGGISYISDNGERVNVGDAVAKVYEKKIDAGTAEVANEIDRYISILEKSIGDGAFTLGESKDVHDNISKIYYEMTRAVSNGNSSIISSEADDFLILLNKMKMYSGNGEMLKKTLDEYKEKKASIEDRYSGESETLKVDEGGYFFRQTDGYEGIYSSANINDISYDSFAQMIETEPSTEKGIGKLIIDYRWYLAIPTVKGISDTFSVGSPYVISFPDNENRSFEMTLQNIVFDSTEARSVMIFECGIVDGDFDYLRVQRVNITHRNVSGYRIPEEAVCELGGNTGVYILKDGMASFRKIIVLYEGDGYYIVSPENSNSGDYYIYLEPNDNIILNCKNMYEGKVIGG